MRKAVNSSASSDLWALARFVYGRSASITRPFTVNDPGVYSQRDAHYKRQHARQWTSCLCAAGECEDFICVVEYSYWGKRLFNRSSLPV